ncbi:hypothetical protein C8J57DRAFT_1492991 [Mycena rebaudengoi]|nr:hypothetical protein C8J57DRAFT_1492991 [Mycena rebaudengoi]
MPISCVSWYLSSTVTRMLSFPQPNEAETIEGCPIVHIPDSAAEVTVFLKTIFSSEFFEPYPAPTEFDIVSGALRLSNKYAVEYLRRRALVHLSSRYFMDISSVATIFTIDAPYCTLHRGP